MVKKIILPICFVFFCQIHQVNAQNNEMDRFIRELIDKMTLEEKIGQLNLLSIGMNITGPILNENVEENIKNGMVGGVFNISTPQAIRKLQDLAVQESRLKIPLIFGLDVIHGYKTAFPIPLGLASCWDMAIIEKTARIAAEEASADGLNWTFSPMVDICRDPRWGRIAEGSGEDAWYGSQVAKAMVRGYQGNDLASYNTILACVKHFALYGASEAGRDYNTVDMSRHRMMEEYMPPYKAAVDEGAGSVMSSFNDINGVPATGNKWLIEDLLRKQWGFTGFVVTDYTAIKELIPHGIASNKYEAAEVALNAGIDMDMVSEVYAESLKQLVTYGKVTETQIDKACRRILEAKYKLGLFSDPYRYINEHRAAVVVKNPEFRAEARSVAKRCMVLLKNEDNILPLKKTGTVALTGPLAANCRDVIGCWSNAGQGISVLEGIQRLAGDNFHINYAKGSNITEDTLLLKRINAYNELNQDQRSPEEMIREAVATAQKSDVVIAVVGEAQHMSGEASSMTEIGLQKCQLNLLKALKLTGKPLIVVLMNGRPLILEWENAHADAILETWFAGSEAGNAIVDILFGDYNPSGKLTVTFPQKIGQIPIYYNHKNTGRPYTGDFSYKFKSRYLDVSNEPLYPFGFGLSYTTFSYGELSSNKSILYGDKDTLTVKLIISNTGDFAGEEIVQMYISDPVASVTRPVKELKGFKKLVLQQEESQEVGFQITTDDLKFYNLDMQYIWEPGDFIISVGPNSSHVQSVNVSWKK